MNKQDFVKFISKKSKLSQKECKTCLEAITLSVKQLLQKGENVSLLGFGKFAVKYKNSRKFYNPLTKNNSIIPATKVPIFKAGKEFREAIF